MVKTAVLQKSMLRPGCSVRHHRGKWKVGQRQGFDPTCVDTLCYIRAYLIVVTVAHARLTVESQRFLLSNLVQKVMTLQGDQSHKNLGSSLSCALSSERSNPEHGHLTQLPK